MEHKEPPMPEIIAPRAVITASPATSEVTCTYGHAVAVDGQVITDVGEVDALVAKYPGVEVKRFTRSLLTPGFVNGHHHTGLTPVQLGTRDSHLETWISLRSAPPAVDLDLDTTYSAAQMIRSGITTVQHLQGWDSEVGDPNASATQVLEAYARIGMRGSYAKLIRDQNFFIHGDDYALLTGLPAKYHNRFKSMLEIFRSPLQDQLTAFTELRSTYAGNPLLAIQLAPANFHWLSDPALEAFGELSATTGTLIHMHLLETIYQSMYMDRRAGANRVRFLAKSGVLSERLTLGHGTWLQDVDIDAIVDAGASVCNNCSSNFRLASGRLPLLDVLAAGVNVGIGIDEADINDDHDMLQEMRLIYAVNREPGMAKRTVTPEQVFSMATVGGARTTGFGDGHGTITVGAPADLVIFDEDQLRHPFQLDGISEVELIVQRARNKTITDVMIGGQWVMVNSVLTTIDETALNNELVDACKAVDRAELRANHEFAASLTVAVRDWFIEHYGF
jgi:cytosine/adenosine deaminase-related metal-dependent hydrolase